MLVDVILEEILLILDVGHKRRRLLLETLPVGGRRHHLPLVLATWRPASRRHHPHSLVELVGRAVSPWPEVLVPI